MARKISTDKAPAAIGPYSQAVEIKGTLYVSGVLPIDPVSGAMVGSSISEQAKQLMRNIEGILSADGLTQNDVVKTTCMLSTMDDFAAFNEVYADYFKSKPARSCFAVAGLPKNTLVEIELVAVRQ